VKPGVPLVLDPLTLRGEENVPIRAVELHFLNRPEGAVPLARGRLAVVGAARG
jgi:hypothetical protein